MTATLAKQFVSPVAAEEHYHLQNEMGGQPTPLLEVENFSSTAGSITQMQHLHIQELDAAAVCQEALAPLEADDQLDILSDKFSRFLKQRFQTKVPPGDFLKLVVQGMERLHASGRTNVIYLLAKALGTTRPDGSDSLLPTSRMPMGLVEYIVNFFTASSVQKVKHCSVFLYCSECQCACHMCFLYIFTRFLVLWITASGSKQCISCLVPSGLSYSVTPCGAMSQSCKLQIRDNLFHLPIP